MAEQTPRAALTEPQVADGTRLLLEGTATVYRVQG